MWKIDSVSCIYTRSLYDLNVCFTWMKSMSIDAGDSDSDSDIDPTWSAAPVILVAA